MELVEKLKDLKHRADAIKKVTTDTGHVQEMVTEHLKETGKKTTNLHTVSKLFTNLDGYVTEIENDKDFKTLKQSNKQVSLLQDIQRLVHLTAEGPEQLIGIASKVDDKLNELIKEIGQALSVTAK